MINSKKKYNMINSKKNTYGNKEKKGLSFTRQGKSCLQYFSSHFKTDV